MEGSAQWEENLFHICHFFKKYLWCSFWLKIQYQICLSFVIVGSYFFTKNDNHTCSVLVMFLWTVSYYLFLPFVEVRLSGMAIWTLGRVYMFRLVLAGQRITVETVDWCLLKSLWGSLSSLCPQNNIERKERLYWNFRQVIFMCGVKAIMEVLTTFSSFLLDVACNF